MDRRLTIPAEFWRSLTEQQWRSVCETSALDKTLCRKLWRMTHRKDKSPDKLLVLINRDDLMRAFPAPGVRH